ncbi:hypothetical protein BK026_02640 [Alteromonas sp. V450]|nr:hypothetical protein BK026_02640 [Alteromonas sp. V450]
MAIENPLIRLAVDEEYQEQVIRRGMGNNSISLSEKALRLKCDGEYLKLESKEAKDEFLSFLRCFYEKYGQTENRS